MRAWLVGILFSTVVVQAAWADGSLIDAVKAGDTVTARQLIDKGADVNATEADGTTALIYAAHAGQADLVEALLKAGADARRANDYGASAMSEAASFGDAGVLEQLLKAGADANSPTPEGQTALMAVARTGKVDAAKALLRHGAHVNATENWGGQSALMWAAAQSQPEMVKLLIDHGADVNARGVVRQWPRKITAEPRPKDLNKGGFTPLLYAARQGCIECARYLIEAGADINDTDPDRVTALNLALINFHFDFAAYLIQAGADVDKWDLYGRTPLYNAVDMNTLPAGGRADVPSMDKLRGIDVAKMLLDAGANPNIQLKLRPPYRNVPQDRGGDVILATGATPLLRAAKSGDNDAIRLILAHHALVDLADSFGVTPLMAAAGIGQTTNPTRGRYKTPEQGAESVRLLLEGGADINKQAHRIIPTNGQTDPTSTRRLYAFEGQAAIHGAARRGWDPVIQVLADHGANLELADGEGLTPMDYAQGKYKPFALDPPPDPLPSTIALLQKLIAGKLAEKL